MEPGADVTYTYVITNLSRPSDKVQLTNVSDDRLGDLMELAGVSWTDAIARIDPATYWMEPGAKVKAVTTVYIPADASKERSRTW